ncbi:MAG TPA: radical SAM protein [Lachnospiraceae bacterium]|nr:radical SAM protein [Lachnospiraceae bacterium]
MERYSKILTKRKREIVLLRGKGCAYRKCPFCDYHLDSCSDEAANYTLNCKVLEQVTGEFGDLEIINSGSVFELDHDTLEHIREVCRRKKISTIHFESHYLYRERIPALRQLFDGFNLKLKLGLETFDRDFREGILKKGIPDSDPQVISRHFEEANFLFGIRGQSASSMERDILLGLRYFERICINIMCPNTTGIMPDSDVISIFMDDLYPKYRDDERIDILIENTDFGVGD